jgi:transposase InsO family protein
MWPASLRLTHTHCPGQRHLTIYKSVTVDGQCRRQPRQCLGGELVLDPEGGAGLPHQLPHREEAEPDLFRCIDGWYSPYRIQRELGWLSPDEYEEAYYTGSLTSPTGAR